MVVYIDTYTTSYHQTLTLFTQFECKEQIVAGKLLRCNPNKMWTVQPTDR